MRTLIKSIILVVYLVVLYFIQDYLNQDQFELYLVLQAVLVPIALVILETRLTPKRQRLTSLFYPFALIIVFIFITNYDLIVTGINSGIGDMITEVSDNFGVASRMFISLLLPIILIVFVIGVRLTTLKKDAETHKLIEISKMITTVLFVMFMFLYYREII